MKISTINYTGNGYGEGEAYIIKIDDNEAFDVAGGEPEDNTLGRDLNFVYDIPRALQKAFEAGKRGEEFTIEHKEIKGTRWDDEDDE